VGICARYLQCTTTVLFHTAAHDRDLILLSSALTKERHNN